MQAKAKDNYRFGTVTAYGGQEYIKGEWRAVPPIYEAEARAQALLPHAILDVREDAPAETGPIGPVVDTRQGAAEVQPEAAPASVVVEGRSAQVEAERQMAQRGKGRIK